MIAAIVFLASLTTTNVAPADAAPPRIALTATAGGTSTGARLQDAQVMLRALNAARAASGVPQLTLDPRLCSIARSHAFDMVERNYFGHVSPDGISPFDRMTRAHYRFGYAGENLALNRTPDAAELALWQSTEHRNNMLEPHYAKVGIAAVPSADGEIFVEDFSD
jgi:uncharacterized protein YkwD